MTACLFSAKGRKDDLFETVSCINLVSSSKKRGQEMDSLGLSYSPFPMEKEGFFSLVTPGKQDHKMLSK